MVEAVNPGTWVTISAFGLVGPRRDETASELVAAAAGGLLSLVSDVDTGRPLELAGSQALLSAGTCRGARRVSRPQSPPPRRGTGPRRRFRPGRDRGDGAGVEGRRSAPREHSHRRCRSLRRPRRLLSLSRRPAAHLGARGPPVARAHRGVRPTRLARSIPGAGGSDRARRRDRRAHRRRDPHPGEGRV